MPASIQASVPMARAAALLNDASQAKFTNAVLLPYLQIAYDEMAEKLEENNIPATNVTTSTPLTITTAMTDIGGSTGPALPNDLIEIQQLFERTAGSSEDWIEMTRQDFLPVFTTKTNDLIYWTWQNQIIQFLGATTAREVKINYIGLTLGAITGPTSAIALFNAKSFLSFRTAALAAQFVGENKERADDLNAFSQLAIDRLLNISTKGRQAIATRRRPFMATYKVNRSSW